MGNKYPLEHISEEVITFMSTYPQKTLILKIPVEFNNSKNRKFVVTNNLVAYFFP
jgi:hypothetical protein